MLIDKHGQEKTLETIVVWKVLERLDWVVKRFFSVAFPFKLICVEFLNKKETPRMGLRDLRLSILNFQECHGNHCCCWVFLQEDEDEADRDEILTISESVTKGAAKDYEEGEKVAGVVLNTHGMIREFNAFYIHKPEDWFPDDDGRCERYTITWYVSRAVTAAGLGARDQEKITRELSQAGMIWPSQEYIQRCKAVRERDAQYKQACRPLTPFKRMKEASVEESALVLCSEEPERRKVNCGLRLESVRRNVWKM